MKWFGVVNTKDKKNSAYIFSELLSIYLILRGIYWGLTLEYTVCTVCTHKQNSQLNSSVLITVWRVVIEV